MLQHAGASHPPRPALRVALLHCCPVALLHGCVAARRPYRQRAGSSTATTVA